MRKREIQSFTLKLNDLKEYDAIKQERAAAKSKDSTEDSASGSSQAPLVMVGPKSKQEIRERIGLSSK